MIRIKFEHSSLMFLSGNFDIHTIFIFEDARVGNENFCKLKEGKLYISLFSFGSAADPSPRSYFFPWKLLPVALKPSIFKLNL